MRANEAARSETGGGVGTGTEMLEDHEDPEDDKMEPLLALEEKEDKNEK